jgi:hypothetical protein
MSGVIISTPKGIEACKGWISISDKLPEEKQPVFYYFGVFDCVYAGFYQSDKINFGDDRWYDSNCFYSDKGFLSDDVTFWQPREEGQELPKSPPTWLRRMCRYHPYSWEETDAMRDKHAADLDNFEAKGFKVKRRRQCD